VPFTLLRVANEMPTLNFLLIKGKKILEYWLPGRGSH
jgi:hypothetical protein